MLLDMYTVVQIRIPRTKEVSSKDIYSEYPNYSYSGLKLSFGKIICKVSNWYNYDWEGKGFIFFLKRSSPVLYQNSPVRVLIHVYTQRHLS